MSEYGDMTLDEYRDALASDSPTPGGGSAAAVSLSQAAALATMVCNLTEGREKWKDGWPAAEKTRSVAAPLLELGHSLASRDALAFDRVMFAYRMPKTTDEETAIRSEAITDATILAYTVPMETAHAAFILLQSLLELAQNGNANAITDVGVAALLASAACKGGLFNAEINLQSLDSTEFEQSYIDMKALRKRCSEVSREIMKAVHSRMLS
ncbi:MAG: cyclodeaminase/cyclohydrolase family protein [Candidatus Poseidoniales archaeon]|nr:cyclodeaminase/cyclohydrolase family protein [Candidatus Poseidoniales archaeon]